MKIPCLIRKGWEAPKQVAVTRAYTSPDGRLKFLVDHYDDGDVILGFDGFPWHTHTDLLVGTYGPTEETAVEQFVQLLLASKAIIAVSRQHGEVVDVSITLDPHTDLHYKSEDEILEFRYWDGSVWSA